MRYELDCACGASVTVAEAAAGTTALCRCGRAVVIPSLRELRRQAGVREPAVAPELMVESLLLAGKLPEEDHCVLCGVKTGTSICCRTECERARMVSGQPSWWVYLAAVLTFGWLGAVFAKATAGEAREWGKDRIFSLPLRVCDACRQSLTSPAQLRAALCRVPLYRRLLNKYPDATVSLLAS
ncbi:MAG TPA: hypothetical protein VGY66_04415 [Gemmataceae bacterium]|nr:hypothetical protein [Gemmataceae bacterium]